MPLTIKRDRFSAALDLQATVSRFIERVSVSGITITLGQESEVLFSVYDDASFPKLGEPHDIRTGYFLRRVVFDSVGYDMAAALLTWEIDGFGGTPSVSVVTESTILTGYASNLLPHTQSRIPIKTLALGPIPADDVTFNFQLPHRQFRVESLMAGELPEDAGDKVGLANAASFRGLGVGYWLVAEHTTSVSRFTGYYQRRLAAISRVHMDWSEGGLVRSENGRAAISAEATLQALMEDPYVYGIQSAAGCVRVCPYPTTDFDAIFEL